MDKPKSKIQLLVKKILKGLKWKRKSRVVVVLDDGTKKYIW